MEAARAGSSTTAHTAQLVGRSEEVRSLDIALDDLDRGRSAAVELEGEAGIGKTRLLSELAARAMARGHVVLSGSASELEAELPFSVFLDALDEYVAGLEPERLGSLDARSTAELAKVFPSLSEPGRGSETATEHERFRTHRAVRALLEILTRPTPLVLVLDDLHWADAASLELLGTLLRRPPGSGVLIALALRSRQVPERLAAALERATRAGTLTRIEVDAFTPAETQAFLGDAVAADEAAALYRESGGNPFYLEQLARSPGRTIRPSSSREISSTGLGVPAAVAASLTDELKRLSDTGRILLEGASVAGDPFESDLAAAAAETSQETAMHAIDELLERDLVRVTDVPRRFRFRHPLVRRAVYGATANGWRLGAHERCAEMLAARGASPAARAHHVERSAHPGDLAAVALLREAGEGAVRLAPESAAMWFAGALRLLPEGAPVHDRVELLLARTEALAAAGRFAESYEAVLEASALVPGRSGVLGTTVATACASVERFLGRYEHAHRRLMHALGDLPGSASVERVELLLELTLNEFYRSRYDAMRDWASPAVSAARQVGDPALIASATVTAAFADAMTGPTDAARRRRDEASALVDGLSDEELSARPHTADWLAITEVYLDLYVAADEHATRALELTRATGQGDPLHRLYPVLPRIWYVRGKLAEAADLLDGAIEAGRLLGSSPALAGNLFNRSVVALAAGDLETALATAEESVDLTRDLDDGFVGAWAAARLAAVLLETGHPHRAVELVESRAGGEEVLLIPGGWRAYVLELLVRSFLALERPDDASRAADRAERTAIAVGLPLAMAWAERAAAAVALEAGDTHDASRRALASAEAAQETGAPIEAALSRTLAGRALAQAGEKDRAVEELQRAAATFDVCGALRYRDAAERELGRLGHRPHRRTRPGAADGNGIETLTERELELAWLVVDRKTNREIAAELFLSQKTVETHLSNIFRKVGVTTRADLARAVERESAAVASAGRSR